MKKSTDIMITVIAVIICLVMLAMALLPLFTTLSMTVVYWLAAILLTLIVILCGIISILA